MKLHITHYFDTFIEVADDCVAETGQMPPAKGNTPTAAERQYEILAQNRKIRILWSR
jgi:Family of unknown function (DUF6157)